MDDVALSVKIAKTLQYHHSNRLENIQRENLPLKTPLEHP